jgi:hypothetical protein
VTLSRRSRLAIAALAAVALGFGVACVRVHLPRTVRVVDAAGRPLHGALLAYHFRGHRWATVQSLTWERPGQILRADEEGNVELPLRAHLRLWPLETGPERTIDLVYVPALHNAVAPLGHGRPGRVDVDGDRLVVADLAGDPDTWADSLAQLYSFLRYDLLGNHRDRWRRGSPETVEDLANGVAAEYVAFQRAWGATPRRPPAPPAHLQLASAGDREAWERATAADLAYAPTWGLHMSTRWEDSLRELRRVAAERAAAEAELLPAEP